MIRAVIIDDEPDLQEINRRIIKENFTDIEILGVAGSVDDGVKLIQDSKPELVFLDIELEGGTGFHILQKVDYAAFKTIFVTAFNQFALKAIKFSAVDYILKPVNEFEFCNAVRNAVEAIDSKQRQEQMQTLLTQIEGKKSPQKVVLRTSEALYLTDINDIIYCKSDNSYTTFYLTDNKSILVSKGMKEYCELFEDQGFFRPHQSYLVNMNHIAKIDKSDGGFIIMKNNKEIPISVRRKQSLMKMLERY
jgi:two-component system, LytTR family, response regulator